MLVFASRRRPLRSSFLRKAWPSPFKPEYDRQGDTLEGLTESYLEQNGIFDTPGDHDPDAAPLDPGGGGRRLPVGKQWIRVHVNPRKRLFDPVGVDGGPNVEQLHPTRSTHMYFSNGVVRCTPDDWTGANPNESQGMAWTGMTIFTERDAPAPFPEPGQPGEGRGGDHGDPSSVSTSGKAAGTFDPKLIDMEKPWDGDTPPVPLPVAGFDLKFERRPDGVWCRKRGKGMYPVDRNGEQWTKPRLYKPDGSLNYDRKPPEINASFWW